MSDHTPAAATARQTAPGVTGGRLPSEAYPTAFADLAPKMTPLEAKVAASRCYYCYDAPCIEACPTGIDIPSFIRKISNGNVRGAATDILGANVMGGTCARACPVETLCQAACVREHQEGKPVEIGRLQRYATDEFLATGEQPFVRAPSNGMKVAVVGAGPAGLSCAHRLATLGYDVTVFEARKKSGGLNEYGLAPYKLADDFAQKEVDFILSIGGIRIEHGKALGRDFSVQDLQKKYAAVFLGIGLGDVNGMGTPGEELQGVHDAAAFIAEIRQAKDLSKIPVGRHVVVIGGGNTAVDIAIQMKRLGAEFVTLVYRRGVEQMGATHHEQDLAQKNGVLIKTWAKPVQILGRDGAAQSMEFEYTELDPSGRLVGTGRKFVLPADQVFKAIGQTLRIGDMNPGPGAPATDKGKILVREGFETTVPGVFAGGDCVGPGEDLTVTAVQQGKLAALAIHEKLNPKAAAPRPLKATGQWVFQTGIDMRPLVGAIERGGHDHG
jgi:glutamate synthase (NADPH/NADH) small chain